MFRRSIIVPLLIAALLLLVLTSACGGGETVTEEPLPTPSATLDEATQEPETTSPPEEESAEPAEGEPTEALVEAVGSRTPEPTRTPGPLDEVVAEVVEITGLTKASFLGLTAENWINLAISALIVLGGYIIGGWLIHSLLRRVVRKTATEFDDAFLDTIRSELRWLVTNLTIQFAALRLDFVSEGLKAFLDDFFFVVYLTLITRIIWKLLDFAIAYYIEDVEVEEGDQERRNTLIILVKRLGYALLVFLYCSILLSLFGINITAVAATLGVAGLALSLAAQDTLSDVISGLIIMIDRPFRIGDRIEISGLGTWGDVVEIGMRTTRIRTRDNRLVIIPNSQISSNQVVNYTFPDPRYRVQLDIGIGYGQDIERTRQIIVETVSQVDGVLKDKPVEALFNEMGDSSMTFRVRWWIESYEDTRLIFDRVNTALQTALDEAGIDMPFITYAVNLNLNPGDVDQLSQRTGDQRRTTNDK